MGSSTHLRFFKECQSRGWSFKDVMLGLESAQLSRNLPPPLKNLICNMSIGFPVQCLGAREAEFDNNGIQNRRDIKCLLQKILFEPPQKNDWTCWPCLDFLKKFKPEVWKERSGISCAKNFGRRLQNFNRSPCWMMKKNTNFGKNEQNLSEEVKNAIVMKLSFGEIKIGGEGMIHNSIFRAKTRAEKLTN